MDNCKAFPEGIYPGDWQVKNGNGSVLLEQLKLNVPLKNDDESIAIRNHEYLHIKYSPQSCDTRGLNDVETLAVKAFEDGRVNSLGRDNNVDISNAININEVSELMQKLSSQNKVFLTISAIGYSAFDGLSNHLTPLEKTIVKRYDEKIQFDKQNFELVRNHALECAKIFNPPEKKPQQPPAVSDVIQEIIKGDRNIRGGYIGESDYSEKQALLKDPIHEIQQIRDNPADGNWGIMHINNHPLTIRNVWKKYKRTDMGYALRYPERVITDKMCFAQLRKAPFNGTILVDISGSMTIDIDELKHLVKIGSGCTIALYSGRKHDGDLHVVAKNGNMVKQLPEIWGRNNIIDVPALTWLSKQRGRKIWVSDGNVTGIGNKFHDNIMAECVGIVEKFKITNIINVKKTVKYVEELTKK